MDAVRFVALCLRLFALWLWWNAAQAAAMTYAVHRGLNTASGVAFGAAALYGAGGLAIWIASRAVARRLAGPATADNSGILTERGAVLAVIVAVGLWCVAVNGLNDVSSYLTTVMMLLLSGHGQEATTAAVSVAGILGLAKMGVGIVLVTGARRLAARIT